MGKLQNTVRKLRKNATPAETRLWEELRKFRIDGFAFRRQHPVARIQYNNAFYYFIADFICLKAKLIVEIDGGIHLDQKEEDDARQTVLENHGYLVLRFSNEEIWYCLPAVLIKIESTVRQRLNCPT